MLVTKIVLEVLLVLSSLILVLTILMHKGSGGGVSGMLGGGLAQSVSSSGVAQRNLDRITVVTAATWGVVIALLALVTRFA